MSETKLVYAHTVGVREVSVDLDGSDKHAVGFSSVSNLMEWCFVNGTKMIKLNDNSMLLNDVLDYLGGSNG